MPDRRSVRPLLFLTLATALAAAGCSKPANTANDSAAANASAPLPNLPATLPMATGPATMAAYAPSVAALPAARPVRAVRVAHSGDAYAYADDAYAFSHALGNAPPDYGFDYQGAEPWAWQGSDDSRTFVEPVSNGYRYYYYRPGADTPYFVRDPDYGYGYDDGSLAVIYGAGGAVLPYGDYGPRLGYASRYLQRGEALYAASRGNDRRAVIAANWAARQNAIAASRDRWAASEARQAGWQAYRARVADQQAQHWAQEAARRDADAQRFAAWHDDGFRGAPPPRAIPVAWQQASWAQDRGRYRVADRPVPQPAFQRPSDPGRPAFGPQNAPRQAIAPVQDQPQRFGAGRGPGAPGDVAGQRAAAEAVRHQAQVVRVQQQQTARATEQQRTADDGLLARQRAAVGQQRLEAERGQQQQAVRQAQQAERQQQQATRQAQQAERRQRATADRAQQDAARPAARQQAVVQVHRGDGGPFDAGRAPRDTLRQQPPPRVQPPHDDQRQADRPQQQAVHVEQQAVHQQQAVAQHVAQVAQHAPAPPHAAPAPHPASHAAPAPHAPGGGHGEHRP